MSFLFVLKLLGVLLLCIPGLLVLILVIPFRYCIEGDYKDEKPVGKAGVSWLLHFVSLKIQIESKTEIYGVLRILCFKIKEFKENKSLEEASANAPEPVNTPYDDSIFVNKKTPDPVPEGTESPKTADTVEEASDTEKKSIIDKLKRAYGLLSEESAGKAVRTVLKRVFKILKSVFPKKGKGHVAFGTGDPYSTGEISEVLTFFYPLYGRSIEITPDFCNKVLTGELAVRGSIFTGKILFEAALIYFNKTAKRLFKELKEIFNEKDN